MTIGGTHRVIGIYKYIKHIGNYQEVVVTGVDQVSPLTLEYQKFQIIFAKLWIVLRLKTRLIILKLS